MTIRYLILVPFFLSPLAHGASTVDLNVTGRITPSACTPSLSNDGVYDLGKIAARDLNVDKTTPLPVHSLQLTITCEALTWLALQPKDNRANSTYDGYRSTRFGLGLINENLPLGYMTLRLNAVTADGVPMRPIGSSGDTTWAPSSLLSHAFLTAFTPNTTIAPASVQRLSADLEITPTIAPSNTLPLAEEMPIDGAMNLTVKYL